MELSYSILASILAGFVGGAVCSLGLRWGISRRCWRMEVAQADLQRLVFQLRGRTGAETRWNKSDREQMELMNLGKAKSEPVRYANDPLVDEGMTGGFSR